MTIATDWSGRVGDSWAAEWRRTDRSLAGLAPPLNAAAIAAVSGKASSVIVDIGCGAGATSLALAAALPHAQINGIDLSEKLIEVARHRAGGGRFPHFVTGAVEQVVAAGPPADLYVSRHGVMFFPDPVAAFSALRAAAAPGARLVFSCFRAAALNGWASDIAGAITGGLAPPPPGYMPGPFGFADPDLVRGILTDAGWRNIEAEPLVFSYRAGEGDDPVADALDFFQRIGPAASALRAAEPAARSAMLDRLGALLERRRTGNSVAFPAAAWLWSAHNPTGETS